MKVVIPAAGWGTRFLPQTKAMPKEMLPIIDKPVIQYVVEEAVSSGFKDIIIITGWHKRAIEDHFDRCFELEEHLKRYGKKKELEEIKRIANLANFIYVRQKGGYGNAIPVLSAREVIGDEWFAVLWGDEFVIAKPPRLLQMLEVYKKYNGIVISVTEVEDVSRYGIIDAVPEGKVLRIKKIVEKPSPKNAPSNLAVIGGYILPPEIFKKIETLKPRKNEIWLTDAINSLIKEGFPAYACKIKNGKYYDTGNKVEYLKTIIELSLKSEFANEIKRFLNASKKR